METHKGEQAGTVGGEEDDLRRGEVVAPSLQSGLVPVPRKGGYSMGVVGAPAPRRSQMGCPGSGLGGSGHLFQTAGQTFGGHGVRFEEPLLLGTPRKMSL